MPSVSSISKYVIDKNRKHLAQTIAVCVHRKIGVDLLADLHPMSIYFGIDPR